RLSLFLARIDQDVLASPKKRDVAFAPLHCGTDGVHLRTFLAIDRVNPPSNNAWARFGDGSRLRGDRGAVERRSSVSDSFLSQHATPQPATTVAERYGPQCARQRGHLCLTLATHPRNQHQRRSPGVETS